MTLLYSGFLSGRNVSFTCSSLQLMLTVSHAITLLRYECHPSSPVRHKYHPASIGLMRGCVCRHPSFCTFICRHSQSKAPLGIERHSVMSIDGLAYTMTCHTIHVLSSCVISKHAISFRAGCYQPTLFHPAMSYHGDQNVLRWRGRVYGPTSVLRSG
jgi:hypothetical protein